MSKYIKMNFQMETQYHKFESNNDFLEKKEEKYVNDYNKDNKLLIKRKNIMTNAEYRKLLVDNGNEILEQNRKLYREKA